MVDVQRIRDEAEYDLALIEIAAYFEREPNVGTAESQRFDALAAVIEAYEASHWPISARPRRRPINANSVSSEALSPDLDLNRNDGPA